MVKTEDKPVITLFDLREKDKKEIYVAFEGFKRKQKPTGFHWEFIALARILEGGSVPKLADFLGVPLSTINNLYWKKPSLPTVDLVEKIQRHLLLNVESLKIRYSGISRNELENKLKTKSSGRSSFYLVDSKWRNLFFEALGILSALKQSGHQFMSLRHLIKLPDREIQYIKGGGGFSEITANLFFKLIDEIEEKIKSLDASAFSTANLQANLAFLETSYHVLKKPKFPTLFELSYLLGYLFSSGGGYIQCRKQYSIGAIKKETKVLISKQLNRCFGTLYVKQFNKDYQAVVESSEGRYIRIPNIMF